MPGAVPLLLLVVALLHGITGPGREAERVMMGRGGRRDGAGDGDGGREMEGWVVGGRDLGTEGDGVTRQRRSDRRS